MTTWDEARATAESLRGLRPYTLGTVIRSYRLGWGWMESIRAWCRIEPLGDGGEMVSLRLGPPPARSRDFDGDHRVWWAPDVRRAIEDGVREYVAGELVRVRLRRPVTWIEP